jgi:hypothetical protein
MLSTLGGSEHFPKFFRGTFAVLALRRLIRFWEGQRPFPGSNLWVRRISSFIKEELFPELDRDTISKLARRVVPAANAAGQNINNSTRALILGARDNHRCYLCDQRVNRRSPQGDPLKLTLDHVWPCAAGGESVVDNLLVACERCQQHKGEVFSWEWHNIYNVVLSVTPTDHELGHQRWAFRFARYSLAAIELAEARDLTLKDAFLASGPLPPSVNAAGTGLPITFFDLHL